MKPESAACQSLFPRRDEVAKVAKKTSRDKSRARLFCAVGGGVVTEVNHESVTEDGLELGTEVRREDADELESVDECFL